jgi:hypothetical protein
MATPDRGYLQESVSAAHPTGDGRHRPDRSTTPGTDVMGLSISIAVGVVSIALGVVIRILVPRPRLVECAVTAFVALVGGELGVLIGAQTGISQYQWIVGIVLGAVSAGVTAILLSLRRTPYPPHHAPPHPMNGNKVHHGRPST